MNYAHLEVDVDDGASQIYKARPRWVTCVAFGTAVLLVTACAISVGLIMGYTYCYLEYRSAFRSGNFTEATNIVHITQLSQPNMDPGNKTFTGAVMNSILMSRILTLVQGLMHEKASHLPWPNDDDNASYSLM